MATTDYKQYEKLGPFEIKDFLAKVASKAALDNSLSYLNAGRGNPNWVATEPREGFFLLGQFAVTECKRVMDLPPGVGGMPARPASSSFITRFDSVSANWPSRKNASRARVAIQFGLPRPALR